MVWWENRKTDDIRNTVKYSCFSLQNVLSVHIQEIVYLARGTMCTKELRSIDTHIRTTPAPVVGITNFTSHGPLHKYFKSCHCSGFSWMINQLVYSEIVRTCRAFEETDSDSIHSKSISTEHQTEYSETAAESNTVTMSLANIFQPKKPAKSEPIEPALPTTVESHWHSLPVVVVFRFKTETRIVDRGTFIYIFRAIHTLWLRQRLSWWQRPEPHLLITVWITVQIEEEKVKEPEIVQPKIAKKCYAFPSLQTGLKDKMEALCNDSTNQSYVTVMSSNVLQTTFSQNVWFLNFDVISHSNRFPSNSNGLCTWFHRKISLWFSSPISILCVPFHILQIGKLPNFWWNQYIFWTKMDQIMRRDIWDWP